MFLQLHSQYAKRIRLGLIFTLFTTIYHVIIFACKEHFHLNTISYKAMIIKYCMEFLCMVNPTSLEFTIAHSPHEMRGMVGQFMQHMDLFFCWYQWKVSI